MQQILLQNKCPNWFVPFGTNRKKGTNRFGQYDFPKFLCWQGRNWKKEHFINLFPTSIITPNAPSICYWTCRIVIFITRITHHNTSTTPLPSLHYCPMPPKSTTKTKKWGQANRDLLANLTNRQLIDIIDTTYPNIDQVRDLHFLAPWQKRISTIISVIIQQCGTSKLSIAARDATEVRCGV